MNSHDRYCQGLIVSAARIRPTVDADIDAADPGVPGWERAVGCAKRPCRGGRGAPCSCVATYVGRGGPGPHGLLDQLQVWSGLRVKLVVVVFPGVILTELACGAHPSLAAISVSGLLRVSSQSTYWPFLSVLRV
jgi:hypothetical protein